MDGLKDFSRIRKLIITYYLPLTAKLEKDFYLEEFTAEGFEVEYWDLSKIFFDHPFADGIHRPYVRVFEKRRDFETRLSLENRETSLFISQITVEYRSLRLYRAFTRFGCLIASYDRPGGPLPRNPLRGGQVIRRLLEIRKYPSYVRTIITRIAAKTGYIKGFDIVFAAGSDAMKRNLRAKKSILVNHFDFDSYLVHDGSAVDPVGDAYAVFLDEQYPLHPDLRLLGLRSLNAETYFGEMNRLFQNIERQYGVTVVVACHPKAQYQSNPYAGRPLLKHKTMDLVKFSRFVIAHDSTSISYGVIYRRPFLFVYTAEMDELYAATNMRRMRCMADILGITPQHVAEPLPEFGALMGSVVAARYLDFENNFLSTGISPHVSTPRAISHSLHGEP
jgi:hypothetical protein